MTRNDVIIRLVELNDVESKAAAGRILDLLTDLITEEVKAGGEVYLGQHFGGFKAAKQAAKTGIAMGKPYSTPEKTVIKFKPSAQLKREVA